MRILISMVTSIAVAVLSPPAMSTEYLNLQYLVESNGYIYLPKGSGVTQLDSGSFVLRVHIDKVDSEFRDSVVVHVKDGSVTPIDTPVSAGDSVSIDVQDVNDDGQTDIIVNEYYEPSFNVRVYLGNPDTGFQKVLDANSIILPRVLDIAPFGRTINRFKEVIMYEDPIGLGGHRDTIIPYIYVFRGDRYELLDNNCSRNL